MRRRSDAARRRDEAGVAVEMVEVGRHPADDRHHPDPAREVQPPTGPDAETPAVPAGPPRRRHRRSVLWVSLTLVLGAVLAANVLEAGADRERRAALGEHPMVLDDLSEPLQEVWRLDGGGHVGGLAGDLLLVESQEAVLAVDAATGEVRWEHRGSGDGGPESYRYCLPSHRMLAPLHPGADLPDSPEGVVVCLETSYLGGPVPDEPRSSVLTVLDEATGRVERTYTSAGSDANIEWVEQDVLVVTALPEGAVRLVRWDPLTGEERWVHTSPEGVRDAIQGYSMMRQGDTYRIDGTGSLVVSLATGRAASAETTAPLPDEHRSVVDLPGGRRAVWDAVYESDGGVRGSGHVEDADGTILFRLPGPVVVPQVSDGSEPGVLLVADSWFGVSGAVDADTGEPVWSLEGIVSGNPLVQVGGVVVMAGSTGTAAVDLRDGSFLWELPVGSVHGTALTDGTVVVLATSSAGAVSAGGVSDMMAVDLRDGSVRWRSPLPPDAYTFVALPGGGVVVMGWETVIGLR